SCNRILRPPTSTLFPYTTLFRSQLGEIRSQRRIHARIHDAVLDFVFHFFVLRESCFLVLVDLQDQKARGQLDRLRDGSAFFVPRSEEHTSELQSRGHLVCRLLLE